MSRSFNVYCDESCHLEHDGVPAMALGAVRCAAAEAPAISRDLRALKARHGLAPGFEAKWTKISPARADYYLALTDFFLEDPRLFFRGVTIPDKSLLNHEEFGQTHDDWYYKMYYTMLNPVLRMPGRYRIYLDVKDTRGGPKTRKLHEVLANSLHDFRRERVERVGQMRSHESEPLQIADLLAGALTYAHRGLRGSAPKAEIVARLRRRFGTDALVRSSPRAAAKFDILVWRPREAAE